MQIVAPILQFGSRVTLDTLLILINKISNL